jgi:uncharacterized phage protein (TIGR01671 family)
MEKAPTHAIHGLHDKNGKEIYERDIVRGRSGERSGEIVWDATLPGWMVKETGGQFDYLYPSEEGALITTEIIGNIYENPNLLTNEK